MFRIISAGNGSINSTALRLVFDRLDEDERQELFSQLNVSDSNEFFKMFIADFEEPLMQNEWYRHSRLLLYYIPPFLLFIGFLGNALSFAVLMRRSMRRVSAYNYLAALSVADSLVLFVGLLRLWVGQVQGSDLKDSGDLACKLINVVNYTVSDYSVWLLVAVTVERYIVTAHALQANRMCTPSRARRVMAGLLAVIFLVNAHLFYTLEVREGQAVRCGSKRNWELLVDRILPWLDAVLYSILPSLLMLALNVAIIRQVSRSVRNRNQLASNTRRCVTFASHSTNKSMTSSKNGSGGGGGDGSCRITIMLLTISFVFIATTLPMTITIIVFAFAPPGDDQIGVYRFARSVGELMMYFNHSINFYLYLLTGQKFRQQLVAMFRRRVVTSGDVETQETEMNGLLLRNKR